MGTWCALRTRVILLPRQDVIVLAAALVLLSSTLVYHACPHGQLLGHLAGVRKFLSAFFHWKGTCGLGASDSLLLMCVCVCVWFLSVYKRYKECWRDRGIKFVLTCRLISVSVSLCGCVWKGDWSGVRDSDGWTCLMCCDNSVRYVAFMGTPCPGDMGK